MAANISIGIQASLLFKYIGINGLNRIAIIPNVITQKLNPFSNSVTTITIATIDTTILKKV